MYKIQVKNGCIEFFMRNDDKDIEYEQKRDADNFKMAVEGIYIDLLGYKELEVK